MHKILALQAENQRLQGIIEELQKTAAPGFSTSADQVLQLARPLLPGILVLEASGAIRQLDERARQLAALDPVLAIGQSLLQVLPPDAHSGPTAELIGRHESFSYETRIKTQADAIAWLRLRALPTAGSAENPPGYVCTLEDITADRQLRLQQAANELHYRSLIENAPVVLYEWRENHDGTYEWLYASPKLKDLFGLTPQDIGLLNQYIHPDDVERWRQTIEVSKRLKQPWHFEGRIQVPGQPLRWWRGSSIIISEDNLGVVYQGILEDITQAQIAKQAIQANDSRWRVAMEGVGSDIWELDLRTLDLNLSAKFRELLGYRRLEQEGRLLEPEYTHVAPADMEQARRTLQAYLRGEVPLFTATYRITDAQGQPHWIASRGLVTRWNEAGEPELLTGTHTDVTEITQAKLNQEFTNRRLASTVANLRRAVLLEDELGRVVLVNDAFCEMFALPLLPEDLTGKDCTILFEQIQPRVRNGAAFGRRILQRRSRRAEIHDELLELRDGRMLEHTTMPLFVEGQYIGRLWKYDDVTKRLTEAEALKRREEKYRSILENMNMGLMEADLEGRVQFANDSFCEITGYTKYELQNKTPEHLLVPQSRPLPPPAVRSPYPLNTYELHVRTKTNELKWLLVSEAPLWNDEKQVVGSIGVYLDITHQKQLESKLREAKRQAEESSRAKELFLANMSHEIRTPMNAIQGMSQLLAKTPLSSQQHNYLHAISTSAENLLVIINDILDLSKIDAGKMKLEHIGFNVRRVCEQVEKTLHYKAEDKGLILRLDLSADLPEVLLGDPYRLTQVLLNLASNSLKFTEKGQIIISCRLTGSFANEVIVQFQVRDSGIGIDPLYLQHLFKNFSQEDSSVSRKYGGTGLGLSISRHLVNLMGGELHVESEKHRGTVSTFSLQFPIGQPADLPRKDMTSNALFVRHSLRGKRVLLVEDNDYNRLLAVSFLTQAQMVVTEAENGAVAVELARHQPFDVILMDVQMPVMNGYEATRELRHALHLQTPIIALTANAIHGDNQRCLEAGMTDYLSKPFQEADLLKIIYDCLQATPKAAETGSRLYSLETLQQAAKNDQQFITLMLTTFIRSSQEALGSLQQSLQQQDLAGIRAAAHRIRPSLHHLQITPLLQLVDELEQWPEPFNRDLLGVKIDDIGRLLSHVHTQIRQDLAAMR